MKVKDYLELAPEYFKFGISIFDNVGEEYGLIIYSAKSIVSNFNEYTIDKISDTVEVTAKKIKVIPILYIRE